MGLTAVVQDAWDRRFEQAWEADLARETRRQQPEKTNQTETKEGKR